MAITICSTAVDQMGRELAEHGTAAFPVACYHDDLLQAEVPWHWHEELEAVLITEGCATVAAGTSRQIITAGNGFFINSGVLHGAWASDSSACRFHSLVFHADFVGGTTDSAISKKYVQPLVNCASMDWLLLSQDVPWQKEALEAIETAWQAGALEGPGYELTVRAALSSLVFQIRQHMPSPNPQSGNKALRDTRRVKAMLSFIHDHYGDTLTVSDISAAASVSESECLRCFRSAIGTTPIQYLKQYRIRQAARLLSSSDAAVSDIAARCGFQDMSYFTKSFREQMHCTPTQYRNAECRE